MDGWLDGWMGGWMDAWVGDDQSEMCGTGLNYKLCFVCLRCSLMIMICYHVTE